MWSPVMGRRSWELLAVLVVVVAALGVGPVVVGCSQRRLDGVESDRSRTTSCYVDQVTAMDWSRQLIDADMLYSADGSAVRRPDAWCRARSE